VPTHQVPSPDDTSSIEQLRQENRQLQERLAFYEGFDLLIQDNITGARELFRLAMQERENASMHTNRARWESGQRETELRRELEVISGELQRLAGNVAALSARVASALGDPVPSAELPEAVPLGNAPAQVAIVVHNVPSAKLALSLQRYVGGLPQVSDVSAREFVGGMLRLDARVDGRLTMSQIEPWQNGRRLHALTERPDVIEMALEEAS
jgi:hypothetical protein